MPAAILFCAALIYLLPEGLAIRIDAKLNLPEPAVVPLVSRRTDGSRATLPFQLDSSLSPKIVKAFYEITFVPSNDNRLTLDDKKDEKNSNTMVVTMPSQKCPYNAFSALCKFYFSTSKVTAVQQADDIIQSVNLQASKDDVPVVAGLVSPGDAAKIVHKYEESIAKKVNPTIRVSTGNGGEGGGGDVPIYHGSVDVQSILRRPEQFYPCSEGPCSWRGAPYS